MYNQVMFYGYARVSTAQQNDTSIEVQLEKLKNVAESLNESFTPYYEKASGKSIDNRSVFSKLLSEVKEGDIIGVYDTSRFGRNLLENLQAINEITQKGVRIFDYSFNQFINPDDPTSYLNFSINSSIATFQRSMQLKKSREGMQKQRSNGDMYLRGDTFGYNYTIVKGKPVVSINEEEAKCVRYIFEESAKGKSVYKLEQELEHIQFKDSPFKLKQPFIRRMLFKPIYMGYYTEHPYSELGWNMKSVKGINTVSKITRSMLEKELIKSNFYEPIVSEELWWEVFEKAKTITRTHATQYEYRNTPYELTGIFRCPVCGNGYVHSYVKKVTEYETYTIAVHKKDCTYKKYINLRKKFAEYMIRACFFLTYLDASHVGKMFEEKQLTLNNEIDEINSQINVIKAKYNELDKEMDNIAEQASTTKIQRLRDKLESRGVEIDKEMTKLQKELDLHYKLIEERNEELDDLVKEKSEDLIEKFIHEDEEGRRNILINACYATVTRELIKVFFKNGIRFDVENHNLYNNKHSSGKPFPFIMYYNDEKILAGTFEPLLGRVNYNPVKSEDIFVESVNKANRELCNKVQSLVDEAIKNTREITRKLPRE